MRLCPSHAMGQNMFLLKSEFFDRVGGLVILRRV
jgi:hypothetical protein